MHLRPDISVFADPILLFLPYAVRTSSELFVPFVLETVYSFFLAFVLVSQYGHYIAVKVYGSSRDARMTRRDQPLQRARRQVLHVSPTVGHLLPVD